VKGSGSVDKALRAEFTHGQACSSAYFSPTGKQILSTSYDDKMRIWNVDRTSLGTVVQDFNPDYVHKHNNQVRYLIQPIPPPFLS
jgi:WD40 repeat protein